MSRHRTFTFTANNYGSLERYETISCKYIVYGKEVGATGTPHLQGTIVFDSGKSLSAAIKALPGCHIEVCQAPIASIAYCKKDGDWVERGTAPISQADKGQVEHDRWRGIRLAAEQGDWEAIPEKVRFQNARLIDFHHEKALKARALPDTEMQHLWYYGEPGTGKSRKAREDHPDAYLKNCNKWWCGYTDQQTVIIEDFDRVHDKLAHHLKIWGDRYPFNAEFKGGAFKIRPHLLIITSNYHPKDIWTSAQDLDPVLRRFKVIRFGQLKRSAAVADLTLQRDDEADLSWLDALGDD